MATTVQPENDFFRNCLLPFFKSEITVSKNKLWNFCLKGDFAVKLMLTEVSGKLHLQYVSTYPSLTCKLGLESGLE